MLSAFPALPISDSLFGNPFQGFESGFTPWEWPEPFFTFPQHEPDFFPNKPPEPVMSNSGSENSNPNPVSSNSGSDEPNQPNRNNNNSCPCSDESNRTVSIIDERKQRRMISNRESARRSRMRKQKHLENMRSQVNRLRIGNRELTNRLRLVTHHGQVVQRDNDRLQSESAMLLEKLWAIRQVLLVRELQHFSPSAWPCNVPITSLNEQNPLP